VADLRNLMLGRGSVKYSRSGFGFFDTLMLGYSYNRSARRVNQSNGNPGTPSPTVRERKSTGPSLI
jgi:hypothetical protein